MQIIKDEIIDGVRHVTAKFTEEELERRRQMEEQQNQKEQNNANPS